MPKYEAGTWVRIHGTVLHSDQRAAGLPSDTQSVPLEIWQKGRLCSDASIGEEVEIVTSTGRKVVGELTEANPTFSLDYGQFIPELIEIGPKLREILFVEGANT